MNEVCEKADNTDLGRRPGGSYSAPSLICSGPLLAGSHVPRSGAFERKRYDEKVQEGDY